MKGRKKERKKESKKERKKECTCVSSCTRESEEKIGIYRERGRERLVESL